MLKFARPHGSEHASPTRPGGSPSPRGPQRERAVFLDDCGPLPWGPWGEGGESSEPGEGSVNRSADHRISCPRCSALSRRIPTLVATLTFFLTVGSWTRNRASLGRKAHG